ncbi:HAMP domain-containing histidine kinase [Paenibacillus sp. P96]|uniref:histidine kinase n=1 Tax=Paenibacillus zeirhizosphaerae TaxID=2987519 RepID=A0ABT9FVU8_9BACL|nr:HAMP domain-containing sensor histidine kinase [Paenibacillus sp. P96]MDP4098820.1 HAMP domain-containing histidine kinase [Paenibacillus sp. P96]
MKRLRKFRNNRKLQSTLVIDFLLFILFFVLLIIFLRYSVPLGVNYIVSKERDTSLGLDVVAAHEYIADWKQGGGIELDRLQQSGGWLELLDANRQVEQVMGNKKDSLYKYSEAELYDLLANDEDQTYYYSITAVYDPEKTIKYLILKIPRDLISISADDDPSISEMKYLISFFLFISVGLILLLVFVYSYWLARRFKKPLALILDGLHEMIAGNYNTRLSIPAEKEFKLIEETFNYMADVIESATYEKRIAQESKQQLMMDLSHDLKTPITSIHGYAQALVEGRVEDKERQNKYLLYIYNKSTQMTRLIQNMLELFKVDTPDFKVNVERKEIGEFLREHTAGIYGDVERKGLLLDFSVPDRDVYAQYDPELLGRVIQNLIANALLYNPAGTHLRVELVEADEEVRIEIADTGIGIPKELWTTIFDPFVRGDQARTHTGGTGLGLAIALKNTEKMGGTLTLRSEGEESSIFTIHLKKSE